MTDASRPKKRARVKRACDRCFLSKDKCNGESPCGLCQKTKSECTYDRPQQRRGPQAGMRTKLEAKIETLESMLGFMLDQLGTQIYQKVLPSLDLTGQSKGSPEDEDDSSSPDQEDGTANDVYPRPMTKSQLAFIWRNSDFAKAVAPGLNLELAEEEPKEEGGTDSKKKAPSKAATRSNKASTGVDPPGTSSGSFRGKEKSRMESASSTSSTFGHQRQESEMGSPFSSNVATGMGPPGAGFQRNPSQSPSNQSMALGIRSPAFPEQDPRLPPHPSSPNRIWERSPHALHQIPSPFPPGNFYHPNQNPHQNPHHQNQHQHPTQQSQPSMYAPSSSRQYLPPSRARSDATHQLLAQMVALPRELEDELDNLLSAFFQHYHIVTPFVDKTCLLRWTSENGVRRFSQAAAAGEETGTLALVLAICSLSAARSADAAKIGEAETAERMRLISLSEDCHARARALFFCSESGSVLNSGPSHNSPGGRADGSGDFEAVQCMLILAIVDIIQNRTTRAWIGLGMAIRLAQDMGLQLEGRNIRTPASSRAATPRPSSMGMVPPSPGGSKDGIGAGGDRERNSSSGQNSHSNAPPQPSPLSNKASKSNPNPNSGRNQTEAAQNRSKIHADQIRRLTWWALFNYDSFLSIALGRSTAIRRSEFETLHPDPAESDEEWALCTAHSPSFLNPDTQELEVGPKGIGKTVKARMISTFVAQTGLSEVLSDLARIVQTKIQPKSGGESLVAQHHAILARLHEWRNNLPPHLQDCIVSAESPTSLAGPSMPTTPAPPNVWSLALHYHFAFIIAQRSLTGALAKERADANLATQATDPLVDDSSISSLWDTRAARLASSRSGEDSKNPSTGARISSSGKSDFLKVTMASPTSEFALPRLLARYISAFGPASLPPTAAFYGLASAHALASATSAADSEQTLEIQKAWENLTWAVSTSLAWHPGLRQVARLLPIFSRAAAATSKTMLRLNPDPKGSPILNPNSPLFNFNPHYGSHAFGIHSDLLPYSMDSTEDELGTDAHALAYALGLPGDSGNTPSSGSNHQSQNLQIGSPLHHFNYNSGGLPSFLGGSRSGTPGGKSEEGGDPLARFFDMGMTDQSSVLYQLGLQPDQTSSSRRNSVGLLFPSSGASHPIQGAQEEHNQHWNQVNWSGHQAQSQPQYAHPTSKPEEYTVPKATSNRRFGLSDGSPHTHPPTPQARPGPTHHHISPHQHHERQQMQMSASQAAPLAAPHQHSDQHRHSNQITQDAPTPRSLVPPHLANDPNAALGAYDISMADMAEDFGDVGDLLDKWARRGSRVDAFASNS